MTDGRAVQLSDIHPLLSACYLILAGQDITHTSVYGSVGTDHQSSLSAIDMSHYILSAQRSHPSQVLMLTHSDNLLAELRLRSRFRSSLF